MTVEQQPDGNFLLSNKMQTLSARITPSGTQFDSIGNSAGKGGFALQLAQWGREGALQPAVSSQLFIDGDVVFHTHANGIAEKFSNTTDGIRQDFIVPVKPTGSGTLQLQLQVSGAKTLAKENGAIIQLASGRQLTYDRLNVTDADKKTIPARINVASNNTIRIVVDDAAAKYPLTIDPTVGDENWVSMGWSNHGIDGTVYAIAVSGSNVYVGGDFRMVANVVGTNYIAQWDGSQWQALSTGMNAAVNALAVDTSGVLYAGGFFTVAGGTSVRYLAKWNGNRWTGLPGSGTGPNGLVSALVSDAAGGIYVAGNFESITTLSGTLYAKKVARWNGGQWSALGAGLIDQPMILPKPNYCSGSSAPIVPSALFVDAGGNLHVGYNPTSSCVRASVATWNGASWVYSLGNGVKGRIYALAVDISGNVYVGGRFSQAGTTDAKNIARWDGSNWSALGAGVIGTVYVLSHDGRGVLYVGGKFRKAGALLVNYVARWDGSNWSGLSSGVGDVVKALAVGSDGKVYVGGKFLTVDGQPSASFTLWDGAAWQLVFNDLAVNLNGVNNRVYAITADGNGNLYVGGAFSRAAEMPVNRVAKWDGAAWSDLDGGMPNRATVYALLLDDSGNLYAGGSFSRAGHSEFANNIARWDGQSWHKLGSGLDGTVYAMAMDAAGNLYAGGLFTTAGAVAAGNVARWDGSNWSALASGVDATVRALAVNSAGNLYAGGDFLKAGTVTARQIAVWNGASWSALGSGVYTGYSSRGQVNAIQFDATGNLFVGGYFSYAGGKSAANIAMWNGTAWSALGQGVSYVRALAVDQSNNLLYAAGYGVFNNVVQWNGSVWRYVGSGPARLFNNLGDGAGVYALATDSQGKLYAGGSFAVAGDAAASALAQWDGGQWQSVGVSKPTNVGGWGLSGKAYAMVADDVGNVYVGGDFYFADGLLANGVAKWDGSRWTVLHFIQWGNRYEKRKRPKNIVYALALDTDGTLYAGGNKGVFKWNGTNWTNMKAGQTIYALLLDGKGNLYAAGHWGSVEHYVNTGMVRKWDGSRWRQWGVFRKYVASKRSNSCVYTLSMDGAGDLYVGGLFGEVNNVRFQKTTVSNIAKFNGNKWVALGSGTNDAVYALAMDGKNNVYAGGKFTNAGGVSANYVARWRGGAWSALAAELDGAVSALTVDSNDNLYAGGDFTSHIAKWDGSMWQGMGSGANGTVNAMTIVGNKLYAGGAFTVAGDKKSSYAAYYDGL